MNIIETSEDMAVKKLRSTSAWFFKKVLLGIFLVFFFGTNLFAFAWEIDESILSPKNLEDLRKSFPEINTKSDLQDFLNAVSQRVPVKDLYADFESNIFKIHGRRASIVNDIEINILTRTYRGPIEALVYPYLKQVDSLELRARLTKSIKKLLSDKGYINSSVSLSTESDSDGGIIYLFKISYGFPCLIESLTFGFKVPGRFNIPVEEGDLCDREKIFSLVEFLEDSFKDIDHKNARIELPKIIYNRKANTARVLISGDIGKKIRYEILDKEKRFFLSDLFTDDELTTIDPNIASPEAMAADLTLKYRDKGYDEVKVGIPTYQELENDEIVYTFEVTPGPQFKITNIQFQGATYFTTDELLEFLGLSGLWQTAPILNLEEIQKGLDTIKSKYQQAGFWDAAIHEPRITKNRERGEAQIVIQINEGLQRILASVSINGVKQFKNSEVIDLLDAKLKEFVNQSQLVSFEKKLKERYLQIGFIYAAAEVKLIFSRGIKTIFTNVQIDVVENDRVRIGGIHLKGLIDTDEKVVLRELFFEPNDWYNPELIDRSRRALLGLGLFRSVQITPLDRNALTEKKPVLDLLITVRESKPGKISFGPGWSLYRGNRFGIESSYNNIGGVGRQVFARAKFSEEANQDAIGSKTLIGRTLSVGYLEPYVLNLPLDGTISATTSAKADETWLLTQSGEVALTHKFRYFLAGSSLSFFYGQKVNREESSGEQKAGYLDIMGGNVRTGRLGFRYKFDNRNDISWPTSGFLFSSEWSAARYFYGGDLAYDYWSMMNSHYFGITDKIVFAAGFSFTSFYNVERRNKASILPVSETIYVGGAETVRGYSERSLGPKVHFDSFSENANTEEVGDFTKSRDEQLIGGSNSSVYKLETRYQFVDSWALSIFTDLGNVFYGNSEVEEFNKSEAINNEEERSSPGREDRVPSEIDDNVPYQFESVLTNPSLIWKKNYAAYGLALNYLTPLGSLNVAYGLPWKRCAGESASCSERGKRREHWLQNGVLHINVGANF